MPDPYASIRAHFENVAGVTVSAGRGAQGLKARGKMFAMFYKGDLLLTLPPDRVEALIGAGRGLPFDPGTGKTMKNRALIPATKKRSWIKLSEEAAAATGTSAAPRASKKKTTKRAKEARVKRGSAKVKLL